MSRPDALPSQLAARLCARVDRGCRGRERHATNGSVGAGGRGDQRELGADNSRGAEATQRQYTEANSSRDGRSHRPDHTGAPELIAECVEAASTPRRQGILRTTTPARSNKVGASSGCAATTHGGGRWRGWPRRPLGSCQCTRVDREGREGTQEPRKAANRAGGQAGSPAHGGYIRGELRLHSGGVRRRTAAGPTVWSLGARRCLGNGGWRRLGDARAAAAASVRLCFIVQR